MGNVARARYEHEFKGPASGCLHCGFMSTEMLPFFCADRQRRHDAFVAAAFSGQLAVTSASVMAVLTRDPSNEAAVSAALASIAAIPAAAVLMADRLMAELAKP